MNPRAARASKWGYWLSRVVLSLVLPLLLVAIAEAALRLAHVGNPTSATAPCTVQGSPATCENLFFTTTFFPRGLVRTPRPYAIPAKKAMGTYRIFVLGESAAYGDPDPAYSFSRYLEIMLRERFPEKRFEVFNTGITAINSHVIVPIAKELGEQKPDLYIIYAGNNEVVGPYGPGTVLTASTMSMPVVRASILVNSARLGQLLSSLLAKGSGQTNRPREWRGMEMFLDRQVRQDSPSMKYAYRNFETNLRDIVRTARSSGAGVLLSTVGTNLKDCAPFASMHRAGLSGDALQKWNDRVQQGAALEQQGQYVQALESYSSAAEMDPDYAELEFRIGRTLWSLGRFREAKQRFSQAADLDTLRFRADTRINAIISSLAANSGAELVDAAAVLAAESPNGVPGGEMFYEHVHLKPRGNYLIARAMFQQIASKFQPSGGIQAPPTEAECERALALTAYDRARLDFDMLSRMEKPPFTSQLNHDEQMFELRIEAQGLNESPDQILAEYRWAIEKNPEDRMLRLKLAMFLYRYDREAAIEQFRLARPYDGFPVITPDGMLVN